MRDETGTTGALEGAASVDAGAGELGGVVSAARRLLTPGESNPKTAKLAAELGVHSAILHLAPHDSADPGGRTVCPAAERNGCAAPCLAFQGRAKVFAKIGEARQAKTRRYFSDPKGFTAQLRRELAALERTAAKLGLRPAVRLDGTSDLGLAEKLHREFPRVTFYDYTKVISRVRRWARMRSRGEAANWHLTFSRGAANSDECRDALELGANVATPFNVKRGAPLPATFEERPVIDGDTHDYRFMDPVGVIVGLRAKGDSAARDGAGFIVRV